MLWKMVCQHSAAEKLLKRFTFSYSHPPHKRFCAPQLPPRLGCPSHTVLFLVLAWVSDTLYAEEGLLGRCNVCQYPSPWGLNTDRSCYSITFLSTEKSAQRNLLTRTNLLHRKVNRKGWESSWLKDMPVHIKIFANCKYIVPLCWQLQLWLTWNVSWLQIEFCR